MNFPTSVLCNEAGQGVLKQKVRNAVNSLNRDWNFCSYSYEGNATFIMISININVSNGLISWCHFSARIHITYVSKYIYNDIIDVLIWCIYVFEKKKEKKNI